MKRELRDVQRQIDGAPHVGREERDRCRGLGARNPGVGGAAGQLEAERRESEKLAMTSGHSLRQLDGEMARVRERMTVYERDLQRVDARESERQQFISAASRNWLSTRSAACNWKRR